MDIRIPYTCPHCSGVNHAKVEKVPPVSERVCRHCEKSLALKISVQRGDDSVVLTTKTTTIDWS